MPHWSLHRSCPTVHTLTDHTTQKSLCRSQLQRLYSRSHSSNHTPEITSHKSYCSDHSPQIAPHRLLLRSHSLDQTPQMTPRLNHTGHTPQMIPHWSLIDHALQFTLLRSHHTKNTLQITPPKIILKFTLLKPHSWDHTTQMTPHRLHLDQTTQVKLLR